MGTLPSASSHGIAATVPEHDFRTSRECLNFFFLSFPLSSRTNVENETPSGLLAQQLRRLVIRMWYCWDLLSQPHLHVFNIECVIYVQEYFCMQCISPIETLTLSQSTGYPQPSDDDQLSKHSFYANRKFFSYSRLSVSRLLQQQDSKFAHRKTIKISHRTAQRALLSPIEYLSFAKKKCI